MKKGNGIIDLLKCPDCPAPLEARPSKTYICSASGDFYRKSDGITNLLPKRIGGERYIPQSDNGYGIKILGAEKNFQVSCLLGDMSEGKGREVFDHIGELLQGGLPKSCYKGDGTITKKGVKLVSTTFNKIIERFGKKLDKENLARMIAYASQARYEGELASMGDYPGNFILPKEIERKLVTRGNALEIAMGNGANIRRLSANGTFNHTVGLDYCWGMVSAAQGLNGHGKTFMAIADAHNLPIQDDTIDLALNFNGLDRYRDPKVALKEMQRVLRDKGQFVIGQCDPLQFVIKMGRIKLVMPKEKRVESLEEAVAQIEGAQIDKMYRGISWRPETVTQGVESLKVNVVVGKIRK